MKPAPRVLVIDDDELFLNLTTLSLAHHGFLVTPVSSGEDGVKEVHTDKHDVVVTDFRLRGLSGLPLVRKIRKEQPDVPIIIITGFGKNEEVDTAVREVADAFLLKPFQIEDLIDLVKKALESRQKFSLS